MNTFLTVAKTVVLTATSCLAACRTHRAGDETLARRDLPGFSLDLPGGVEKIAELNYSQARWRCPRKIIKLFGKS